MRLTVVAVQLTVAMLAGCVHSLPSLPGAGAEHSTARSEGHHADTPLLQLPPSALGKNMAAQQRLTIIAPAMQPRTLDVLLEVDIQTVRLALLQMGQVAARLEWDGVFMQASQSRWWPREVSAERILSDMQLALWPTAAIQAALPTQWQLQEQGGQRVLLHGDDRVIVVRRPSPQSYEIEYVRANWLLRIESQSLLESAVEPANEVRP